MMFTKAKSFFKKARTALTRAQRVTVPAIIQPAQKTALEVFTEQSARTDIPFFVYGTLRPGEGNYAWALQGRTITEDTATVEGYDMFSNGGFPYLVPGEGTAVGTLVTHPTSDYAAVASDLDNLEGFHRYASINNLYDRVLVEVDVDGEPVEAWMYVSANPDGIRATHPQIPSGDWFDREPYRAPSKWNMFEAPTEA